MRTLMKNLKLLISRITSYFLHSSKTDSLYELKNCSLSYEKESSDTLKSKKKR